MDVTIATAREQLEELVHRAEAGEEIILTRDGRSVARIGPVPAAIAADHARPARGSDEWRQRIDEITRQAVAKFPPGKVPSSSHDDMYDAFGLPI
ncbi:type II toxin-antitoxin system Phd/YefM family antitoxin [Devosia sp.]|jgi:prevent-host-death family protein|uniref:type II toxin-antitoxin system Phd/YefM family antitoxin n=1 Tax=Devosia sp. TaxID=1871048 RepID=UPI003BACBDDB